MLCLTGAVYADEENLLCEGGFEFGTVSIPELGPIGPLGCWSNVGAQSGVWIGPAVENLEAPHIEGELFAHIGNSILDGGVEQSFGTNIGSEYQVSLWGLNWQGMGDGEATVRVYSDSGQDDLGAIFTAPESQADNTLDPYTVWTQHIFTFVASSTTSTLEIMNCGNSCSSLCSTLGSSCGHAMNIDDIRVISLAPVVAAACNSGEVAVWEEGESSDCFTVVLTEPPGAEVTVIVDPPTADVSLNAEAPNDPITLTFTTADWDVAHTVNVTAYDDALPEGTETITIAISGTSSDSKFVFGAGMPVTVLDNDAPGIRVEQSQGSTSTEEGGVTDSYTIVLTAGPSTDVDIRLQVSDELADANQVVVDPESLTFGTGDWDTPQTVTVTAVDDDIIEGHPHSALVTHAVNSNDSGYYPFDVDDVFVSVGENDCDVGAEANSGQTFFETDLDLNCFTDVNDLALFVSNYLHCTLWTCH